MVDYDYKIRGLTRWEFPDRYELMQPYTGDDSDRLARIEAFRAFSAELEKMPPEEVDPRYMELLQLQRDQQEQAARRNDEMQYFSQPGASADFAFWCDLETWTIDEATALMLGKDPSKVVWEDVCKLTSNSLFAVSYRDLRLQLLRAMKDGKLTERDEPKKFIEWASSVGRQLPDRMRLKTTGATSGPANELNPKERESLLKMVLGMAMAKYGFDPQAKKNSATTEIKNDLIARDLRTDDGTILKFLRQGAEEFLDQNRTET
jgi:hypothetical protein